MARYRVKKAYGSTLGSGAEVTFVGILKGNFVVTGPISGRVAMSPAAAAEYLEYLSGDQAAEESAVVPPPAKPTASKKRAAPKRDEDDEDAEDGDEDEDEDGGSDDGGDMSLARSGSMGTLDAHPLALRIMIWNITNFSNSAARNSQKLPRILGVLRAERPAVLGVLEVTAAARADANYSSFNQNISPSSAGAVGVDALRDALIADDGRAWLSLISPVNSSSQKADHYALIYDSDVVTVVANELLRPASATGASSYSSSATRAYENRVPWVVTLQINATGHRIALLLWHAPYTELLERSATANGFAVVGKMIQAYDFSGVSFVVFGGDFNWESRQRSSSSSSTAAASATRVSRSGMAGDNDEFRLYQRCFPSFHLAIGPDSMGSMIPDLSRVSNVPSSSAAATSHLYDNFLTRDPRADGKKGRAALTAAAAADDVGSDDDNDDDEPIRVDEAYVVDLIEQLMQQGTASGSTKRQRTTRHVDYRAASIAARLVSDHLPILLVLLFPFGGAADDSEGDDGDDGEGEGDGDDDDFGEFGEDVDEHGDVYQLTGWLDDEEVVWTSEDVPGGGDCFYHCVERGLPALKLTQEQVRARLVALDATADGHADATDAHIVALANDLDLTVYVHTLQYGAAQARRDEIHDGAAGTLHVLHVFGRDGMGHYQILRRAGDGAASAAAKPLASASTTK